MLIQKNQCHITRTRENCDCTMNTVNEDLCLSASTLGSSSVTTQVRVWLGWWIKCGKTKWGPWSQYNRVNVWGTDFPIYTLALTLPRWSPGQT